MMPQGPPFNSTDFESTEDRRRNGHYVQQRLCPWLAQLAIYNPQELSPQLGCTFVDAADGFKATS